MNHKMCNIHNANICKDFKYYFNKKATYINIGDNI